MELSTNIRNDQTNKQTQTTILYSFEANTTIDKLDFPAADRLIASNLKSYLKSDTSGLPLNSIATIKCTHKPELNESFSSSPTPAPTMEPTEHPTKRMVVYDDIYIPVVQVSLSSAKALTNAVDQSSTLISITCDTSSPTISPTSPPTNAPEISNITEPDGDIVGDTQLVIFGYGANEKEASSAITFPQLDFDKFQNVIEDTCMLELDDNSEKKHKVYLVSVDSIYSNIENICIRYNNRPIVLKPIELTYDQNTNVLYRWTAEDHTSDDASCSESAYKLSTSNALDRGTYCFAVWILEAAPKTYHFRMKKRFIWTPNFINIMNSIFVNNIATDGKGGAIAIVSKDGIDEYLSAKISHSKFERNYGRLGGATIYREWSFAEIDNYQSNYMSVIELDNCIINTSVVVDNEGGSILTDLASTHKADGLFFKTVLSITDCNIGRSTTAGDESSMTGLELKSRVEDGFGGVLNFKYSNVYIANSVIDFGEAYQGGGIHLLDTAFHLFSSSVQHNEASDDGGGLYQALYQEYEHYDLCVSIYRSIFTNNTAGELGGAIYSQLFGSTEDNLNAEIQTRESCFKIVNGTFKGNGDVSVYINVTQGTHRVLRNEGELSTLCADKSDCDDFKSVLRHLCVTEIPAQCGKLEGNNSNEQEWDISKPNPLAKVKNIPGASIILYIYGMDAFNNRMLATEFGILASADGAQVINPGGTLSQADVYQYIVPLVVGTGSKDAQAQIIVEDVRGVADPVKIQLQITDCEPGYYQEPIKNSNLFNCKLCDVDKYTMGTNECKTCPPGFECLGGNNVKVKENWYGKVGDSTCEQDPDNSYITSTLCPPNYCCNYETCQFPTGFRYTDKNKCGNDDDEDIDTGSRRRLQDGNTTATNETVIEEDDLTYETSTNITLCAANRDPSVVMCGACLPGYSETLSSAGNCAKCKGNSHPELVPLGILICFGIVYFFYFMGKRERTRPHPAMTYASKTLLFFYQILTFLTFRSSVQVVKPLAELVNFNFDVSEDGTCLFEDVTSRTKLWLNLLSPLVITFDLCMLLGIIWGKHAYRKKKNAENNAENIDEVTMESIKKKMKEDWDKDELAMQSAFWGIFMIVYVQITSSFIKLSICYPFGDAYYMWYAGDVECADAGLIFCMIMGLVLILIVPWAIFRAMKWYKDKNIQKYESIFAPLILAYSNECWFYTPFNVFRRAILIVLPSLPTKELSVRATLSTFSMGSLIIVHCYLMPFQYTANNHLETFVLLCGFFISTLNITDSPPEYFPYLIAILAVIPLVPIPFLFHDFIKGKADNIFKNFQFEWTHKNGSNQLQSPISQNENNNNNTFPPAYTGNGNAMIQLTATSNTMQQTQSITYTPEPNIDPENDYREGKRTHSGRRYTDINDDTIDDNKEDDAYNGRRISLNLGPRVLNIYKVSMDDIDEMENDEDMDNNDDNDDDDDMTGRGRRKTTVGSVKEARKESITKYGTEFDEWGKKTLPNVIFRWFNRRKKDTVEEYSYEDPPSYDNGNNKQRTGTIELPEIQSNNNQTMRYMEDEMNHAEEKKNNLLDIDENKLEYEPQNNNFKIITTKHNDFEDDPTWNPMGDLEYKRAESVDPPEHNTPSTDIDDTDENYMIDIDKIKTDIINDNDKEIVKPLSVAELNKKPKSKLNIFSNRNSKVKSSKYYSICVQQIGWKLKYENKQNDNNISDETDDNDDETDTLMNKNKMDTHVDSDINVYKMVPDIDEIEKALSGVDAEEEYIVPNEYLYINGNYGPKEFDKTFKSMIYSHNKLETLEIRVLDKKYDNVKKDQLLTTWSIIDMVKQKGFYKATNNSLIKPPLTGWKRLIDNDEIFKTKNIDSDLQIDITTNTLDPMDIPEIVSIKSNKQLCVSIECDYKKPKIINAPHLKQWIELIAHNQTNKNDNKFEIIDITNINEKEEEIEEKKVDPDDIYKMFMNNKEKLAAGNELQKKGWIRKTFDFNNLIMKQKYKFKMKLSNTISYSESLLSNSIIPQTIPSSGLIDSIRCDPESLTLTVNYKYLSESYNNKSMNSEINLLKLFIKILPFPGNNSAFIMNDDELFKLNKENKYIEITHKPIDIINNYCIFQPLIISKIHLGVKYKLFFEAENNIGLSLPKDPFIYVPLCKPPKPIIHDIDIDENEWKMSIHFRANGYDNIDCDAAFKLELIDPLNNNINDEKEDQNQNQLQTRYESTLDERILNILNKRHEKSPIILNPLFAGQHYIVRIQCINAQGIAYSDNYKTITLEIPPTTPQFTTCRALDGSVLLKYECPNYNFYKGYEPIYEIKTTPTMVQNVLTKQTQGQINALKNGWDYVFEVRAKNEFGTSDWSKKIKLKPLKEPKIPLHIHTVCGNECISVFWCSLDDMRDEHIQGKFIIKCDQKEIEEQIVEKRNKVEFNQLNNNKSYKFQIFAVNDNFKIESEWTKPIKPIENKDDISYKHDKSIMMQKIMKIRNRMKDDDEKEEIIARRQFHVDRIQEQQRIEKEEEIQRMARTKVPKVSVADTVKKMGLSQKKFNQKTPK